MREIRSSGSVEGVMSNRDPYSDLGRCPQGLKPGVERVSVARLKPGPSQNSLFWPR
jgi:hypothetical protein